MKIFNIILVVSSIFLPLINCIALPEDSPACKRIAFAYYAYPEESDADIYTVCPDGSDLIQLTDDPAFDGDPAWSPDGERIAFTSMRSGDSQIHIMNADGSQVVQLTFDLQNNLPIWLPNGEQIAFRTTDGNGLWWWRLVDLRNNEIQELTEPSYDFFYQKQAWSPDGQSIAYMSLEEQKERNDGSSQIHTKNINGSGDFALTDNIWANVNPVWSPDGQWLAFLSEMDGQYNIYRLFIIRSDGSELRRLGDTVYSDTNSVYSWSPDGSQIAIGDLFIGHISIIDLSSGESRDLFLMKEGETALSPTWQP